MPSSFDKSILESTSTRLGEQTFLKGELRFESSMRISGKFQGSISSGGFLFVEQGAEVEADIFVTDVVIGGTVRGNIEAEGMVEMLESAKIYGNVRAAKLRIADGVVFEGRCEMLRKGDSIDIFSAPLKELRENILRDE